MEVEWWKLLGQEARQNPITTAELVEAPNPKAIDPSRSDIPFEDIGAAAGAAIGFSMYVWTYPIVWIDGPLPIVDALWFGGLVFTTSKWSNFGRRLGKKLDIAEDVLL
jgi:hypothetical protein